MAVEKIENVLKRCPLVEQIWVYGNSFESCLLAVVVPNKKALMEWAAAKGLHDKFEVCGERVPGGGCVGRGGALCSLAH